MNDKDLIKSIAKKYGTVIDLKANPALMLEILKTHGGGGKVNIPDGGVSVAGVGKPPGPSGAKIKGINALGNVLDNTAMMKEILKLSKQVTTLSEQVKKLKK